MPFDWSKVDLLKNCRSVPEVLLRLDLLKNCRSVPEVLLRLEVRRTDECRCGQIRYGAMPIVVEASVDGCDLRVGGYRVASFDRNADRRMTCELACSLFDVLSGNPPGTTEWKG